MQAIERAIKCFGSQVAMASALGVKQPTISEWLRGDRRVPAEHCPRIERMTRERGEAVRCEDLRPDIEWEVLRLQAAPADDHAAAPATAGQGA
jgi:DNA-binding transcriptional regulator YdaS (Cro superfamily)